MKALVLDIQPEEWEVIKGMGFSQVPEPKLDESKNPADGNNAIVKPLCKDGRWFTLPRFSVPTL